MRRIFLLLMMSALSACNGRIHTLSPAVNVPNHWKHQAPQLTLQPPLALQWLFFNNQTMQSLIETSLLGNLDLEAAIARVQQARESAKIRTADVLPTIDYNGSATHTFQTNETKWSHSITAGVEIDLWGRLAMLRRQAQQLARASEFDRDEVALVVATDTAQAYLNYCATSARLFVARENLANANRIMKIVDARFREGAVSQLELSQQRNVLNGVRATIFNLQQSKALYLHQLAVLTRHDAPTFALSAVPLNQLQTLPLRIRNPLAMLSQRPDLQRIQLQLIAAHFGAEAAGRALLPSLNVNFTQFLTMDLSTLVSSLTQPIFAGGAIVHAAKFARAQEMEIAAQYKQAILQAMREAEDARAKVNFIAQQMNALRAALRAATLAYRTANEQYLAGAIDYQSLLDVQRTLYQSKDAVISADLSLRIANVELFKALGGDQTRQTQFLIQHR